jgi:O-antigen ligase
LMKHENIVKGYLWAFAVSAILLAILQLSGVTSGVSGQGRITAFDQNPNSVASALSLGLLAGAGLAFGREKRDWKACLLFCFAFAIVAGAIVQTGGRGAMVALVASLSLLFLQGKSLVTKLKLGLMALVTIAVVGFASYQIDAVRKRWEKAVYEGSMSGRETIWVVALEMIMEKPLLGWGPAYNTWELGSRLGGLSKDAHNMYLRLLAEGGIVGAFPFFVGLWLCWQNAWRARHSSQGIVPLIMLLFLLVMSLTGGPLFRKLFWVVLSYALASSSYAVVQTSRQASVSSQYTPYRATQYGIRFKPPKTSTRPARKVFGVPRHS